VLVDDGWDYRHISQENGRVASVTKVKQIAKTSDD